MYRHLQTPFKSIRRSISAQPHLSGVLNALHKVVVRLSMRPLTGKVSDFELDIYFAQEVANEC